MGGVGKKNPTSGGEHRVKTIRSETLRATKLFLTWAGPSRMAQLVATDTWGMCAASLKIIAYIVETSSAWLNAFAISKIRLLPKGYMDNDYILKSTG